MALEIMVWVKSQGRWAKWDHIFHFTAGFSVELHFVLTSFNTHILMICEDGVALSCSMKQHTANSMKVTVKSIPHTLLKRRSDAEIWVAQSIWKKHEYIGYTRWSSTRAFSKERESSTGYDLSRFLLAVKECVPSVTGSSLFQRTLVLAFSNSVTSPILLTDWLDCRSACFIVCMCCPEKSKVRVLTLTEAMRSNSLCVSMKRGRSPQKTCSMPVRGSLTGGTIWPSPAAAPPLP